MKGTVGSDVRFRQLNSCGEDNQDLMNVLKNLLQRNESCWCRILTWAIERVEIILNVATESLNPRALLLTVVARLKFCYRIDHSGGFCNHGVTGREPECKGTEIQIPSLVW